MKTTEKLAMTAKQMTSLGKLIATSGRFSYMSSIAQVMPTETYQAYGLAFMSLAKRIEFAEASVIEIHLAANALKQFELIDPANFWKFHKDVEQTHWILVRIAAQVKLRNMSHPSTFTALLYRTELENMVRDEVNSFEEPFHELYHAVLHLLKPQTEWDPESRDTMEDETPSELLKSRIKEISLQAFGASHAANVAHESISAAVDRQVVHDLYNAYREERASPARVNALQNLVDRMLDNGVAIKDLDGRSFTAEERTAIVAHYCEVLEQRRTAGVPTTALKQRALVAIYQAFLTDFAGPNARSALHQFVANMLANRLDMSDLDRLKFSQEDFETIRTIFDNAKAASVQGASLSEITTQLILKESHDLTQK